MPKGGCAQGRTCPKAATLEGRLCPYHLQLRAHPISGIELHGDAKARAGDQGGWRCGACAEPRGAQRRSSQYRATRSRELITHIGSGRDHVGTGVACRILRRPMWRCHGGGGAMWGATPRYGNTRVQGCGRGAATPRVQPRRRPVQSCRPAPSRTRPSRGPPRQPPSSRPNDSVQTTPPSAASPIPNSPDPPRPVASRRRRCLRGGDARVTCSSGRTL